MLNRSQFHCSLRLLAFLIASLSWAFHGSHAQTGSDSLQHIETVPGMPPVVDPNNLYSETSANRISSIVANATPRVYVPNIASGDVDVIDPATLKVVDHFKAGRNPQHVVPSWDLKTLWVAGSAKGRKDRGSLLPIDAATGKPSRIISVPDAYNLYFTPDGQSAIVVAEARRQLEFRDPKTMSLRHSLAIPQCAGINHADFSIDGRYAVFTCEFSGSLVKIDLVQNAIVGFLKLSKGGMPQDIRISPDGSLFYVADMMADGVFLVKGETLEEIGFIATGIGAHGLYPSRDSQKIYVSNRGSHHPSGPRHGPGSVSVIDFSTRRVETTWPIPGGGSPDMGQVSADGKQLWLSGRFDNVVYVIDTDNGTVQSVPVGREPHGLTVWPQPGRYSLGHTGNMR
ncbi:YncE family protein [Microvirga puerhi]|uniref:YncE family protein n=1 Tax=Microvirga puerhi TaxID=2876078 RepID=A0ABS7VNV4_9HYPH|nr:YncE family protein [Microvirga puerhi]MBZ6077224.1 YncE family protein [Microvirga puerhi]